MEKKSSSEALWIVMLLWLDGEEIGVAVAKESFGSFTSPVEGGGGGVPVECMLRLYHDVPPEENTQMTIVLFVVRGIQEISWVYPMLRKVLLNLMHRVH